MIGAPDIRSAFGLDYTTSAFVLLALPELVSFLLEPPLFILSDRIGRHRLVPLGLVLLGLAFVGAGLARGPIAFAIAMVIIFPTNGLGVGLAQVALIEAYPRQRERVMTRWTLMGSIGDLASPLFLAALALVGLSWRSGFVAVGAIFFLQGVLVSRTRWRGRAPRRAKEEEKADQPGFWRIVRESVRNRRLWIWSGGVALCSLLDETFIVFATMHLTDRLHASRVESDLVIAAFGAGAIAGLSILDRVLARVAPLRVLIASSLMTVAVLLIWLGSQSIGQSIASMFFLGVFVAPLYPIAQARAYESFPERAGAVVALGQLFGPLTLAFPFILGRIADDIGIETALLLLLLQPIGLVLIAVAVPGRGRTLS